MRRNLTPVLTLMVGVAVGAIGAIALRAQQPLVKEAALLKTDLAGLQGQELIISRFETGPGWVHGRHYHAGHESVYVLEGSAILEVEGREAITLTPGSTSYVPPRRVHAGRNASQTAPFKFLLIRIHDKSQPLAVELE